MTDQKPVQTIKTIIEVPGKETFKFMFYSDTKILNVEEFLKRRINLKPT
jgi:hypothetical protein